MPSMSWNYGLLCSCNYISMLGFVLLYILMFCAIICGLLGVVFAYYSCIAMGCYGPGFLHPNHHTQHLQNIGQTMDMQLGAPCKPTMDMGATRKCKLIYFGHFMQASTHLVHGTVDMHKNN